MERLFRGTTLALCLLGAAFVAPTGPAAAKTAMTRHAAAKPSYVCPKCGMISGTAGQCSHCKVALVRSTHAVAAYECKMCHVKSTRAGKCPMCGMPMTKVSAKPHKM